MKKYKVKYTVTTHSRYGNYVYKDSDTVEAMTADEAVDKVRARIKEKNGQWKFKKSSVIEIA